MKNILFKKYLVFAMILFGVLFFARSSWAATYYVRTDGHDTNCNGLADYSVSHGNPCAFLTVKKGVNTATAAGDTVTIHAGGYTGEGTIVSAANGSSGNLITVQGYPGETVSLTNIKITHNYNKFDHFTLTLPGTSCDGSQAAMILGGNNNIVSNCYVYGTPVDSCNTKCPIGVLFDGGSYNTVLGNTFEGYFTYIFAMHGANNTIQNNTIKNIIDIERIFDALFVSSSITDGTIITGNEIYNYTSPQTICSNHPDIIQVVDQGGLSSAKNWVITNNYFHDSTASISENGAGARTTGWNIRNNVFANIRDAANFVTPNTVIQNNTFFQVALTQAGVMSVSNNTAEIRNNVIIGAIAGPTHGMIDIQGGATPTLGYNFFSLPKANGYGTRDSTAFNAIKGTGSINGGDPKFVAAYDNCITSACDFKLQADSLLKDMGATLTGFSTDKDGITRPQGLSWDIGAYEYVSAAPPPDTTPPAAPSGLSII